MGLRILWLNWRCPKHPLAGGAEIYTHEIARRLSRRGHHVILVAPHLPGLPQREIYAGYQIVRVGGNLTIYWKSALKYLQKFRGKVDVVVEEINTIPFMTPLYADEPVVILIHQLCMDCWKYSVPKPAAIIGRIFEEWYHRVYTGLLGGKIKRVITVSRSTFEDLVSLGYDPSLVSIVYNGVYVRPELVSPKTPKPTLIYFGRITRYKRVEHIIKAYNIVRKHLGSSKIDLIVAGRPEPSYFRMIKRLAEKLSLPVIFRTDVKEQEKYKLLSSSWLQVYASAREGWGRGVLEAAALGTPTVAYNVPGLRDAILDKETGILVNEQKPEALAKAIIELLNNEATLERLSYRAMEWASRFDWESSATRFEEILLEAAQRS